MGCTGVSDEDCTLSYRVVRVAGASIHGVLVVEATACRVQFNKLVAHDDSSD